MELFMKAAVLKSDNSFVVEECSIPEIKSDEVLIKVKACGVCHTDLHYIDHGIKTFKPAPIILGHEASGIIIDKGAEVKNFNLEDRVIIPAVLTCGKCKFCLSGRENICNQMIMPGNHINGAYAEYIVVPAKNLKILPENLSFEEGALIADAISTAYHAVMNRAKIKKGDIIVVIGCGGIGQSVIQLALSQQAQVIAIDINDQKLKLVSDLGVKITLNPAQSEIVKILKQEFKFGLDYIFEVAGTKESFELTMSLSKQGANIILVGYNPQKMLINPAKVMFMEQTIMGSVGCPPKDFDKVIQMVQSNQIDVKKMITARYKLEDINLALEELRNSRGLRSVIVFD